MPQNEPKPCLGKLFYLNGSQKIAKIVQKVPKNFSFPFQHQVPISAPGFTHPSESFPLFALTRNV